VRVLEKSLAPSVEQFGISRDLEEGLGGGPKQQAVNRNLILQGEGS
jgi:hypothetical protein